MSILDDINYRDALIERAERIMEYADEEADRGTAFMLARQELPSPLHGSSGAGSTPLTGPGDAP